MFDISDNGNISVNGGDSFETPLFINKGTEIFPERYQLTENDELYFALMQPNQKFEDAILKKVFTSNSDKTDDGDILIQFSPIDTLYLLPGKYYYTVRLRTIVGEGEDDFVDQTIIPQKEFYVVG